MKIHDLKQGTPEWHAAQARKMRDEAITWFDEHPSMAAQAGVKPERALRLVSDRDAFEATIQAMGTAA